MQALSAFRAQIVNILKYDIFKKSIVSYSSDTKANYSLPSLPCKLIVRIVTNAYKYRPSVYV